MSDVVDGLKD